MSGEKKQGSLGAESAARDVNAPVNAAVPRAARVSTQGNPSVQARLTQNNAKLTVDVFNISATGIALESGVWSESLSQGAIVSLELLVANNWHGVQARIVHQRSGRVGLVFVDVAEKLSRSIERHFELEISAIDGVEVDPRVLRRSPDGDSHWIQGKNNCGLFWVEKDSRVLRFELTFLGNRWESDASGAVIFVRAEDDESFIEKPDPESIELASRILKHMSALRPEVAKSIRDRLQSIA